MSTASRREVLEAFVEGLSDADALALWRALRADEQCDALAGIDGLQRRLEGPLLERYTACHDAVSAAERARIEARAASEGLRFCAQAPEAFAELGPRVRVYLTTSGEPRDRYSTEYGHSDDEDFNDMHYSIDLIVTCDGQTVVRFAHRDEWSVSAYDTNKVEIRYQGVEKASREVSVPEGVPLSAHEWSAAARAYLAAATRYYAPRDYDRSEWSSTEPSAEESDDDSSAASAEGAATRSRKRSASAEPTDRRLRKRR